MSTVRSALFCFPLSLFGRELQVSLRVCLCTARGAVCSLSLFSLGGSRHNSRVGGQLEGGGGRGTHTRTHTHDSSCRSSAVSLCVCVTVHTHTHTGTHMHALTLKMRSCLRQLRCSAIHSSLSLSLGGSGRRSETHGGAGRGGEEGEEEEEGGRRIENLMSSCASSWQEMKEILF